MAKIQPLKKLTPQAIGFDPKKIDWPNQETSVFVMRVVGLAKGLRPYTGIGGEKAFGLRGVFKAVSPEGVEYSSGVYYPPAYIQETIEGLISDDDDFEGVKIAMDVFCKRSTNTRANSSPYEFIAEIHTEAQQLDVIGELESQMPDLPKMIAAPATKAIGRKTSK